MRKIINELLDGQFETDTSTLDFSCSKIEINMNANEIYEGSFFVYGPEERPAEGFVLSSEQRMECQTEGFIGTNEELFYRFRSDGMEEGETLAGSFFIVSDCGEYELPFTVHIEDIRIESSMGEIRNVFHFTNLAKTNWKEAVSIFYAKSFEHIFKEGSDRQYYSAYKGLSAVRGNEHNIEEFLLQIHKKQRIEYIPEQMAVCIEDPSGSSRYLLNIKRSGWGHTSLTLSVEGDFLSIEKDTITEDDFADNTCSLAYVIDSSALHTGNNFGRIRINAQHQELWIDITVVRHAERKRAYGIRKEKQRMTLQLMEYYESFRTKKISGRIWMTETNRLVERLLSLDTKDVDTQLFHIQLLLTDERKQEAKWMLDKVESRLDLEYFPPQTLCYFLYLQTLYVEDEQESVRARKQAELLFLDHQDNFWIAWLYMHMAEEYAKSPTKKWLLLKEQFKRGSRSPVLYVEAWHLVERNPTLLMKLGEFEVQVLNFASRRSLLTQDVMIQFIYLASRQKEYSERVFIILKECYECFQNIDTLQAICTLLIKGGKTGEQYFPWYRMGVEQELRITRLYEYYMMSIPEDFEEELPKMILMYFSYHSDLSYQKNAFLYSYVYKNREEHPETYLNYCERMEHFVLEQITKGRINRCLAYLYQNTLVPRMITAEVAERLAALLFMHEITVYDKEIRYVTVSYAISKEEHKYSVVDGKAQAAIYGSDYQLLLEDREGNRFCADKPYDMEKLIKRGRMVPLVAPYVSDHMGMDVFLCEENKSFLAISEQNVGRFRHIASSDHIEEESRSELRLKLIHYYYEHDYIRELDSYLEELIPDAMSRQERNEVLRFLVMRGLYDKAFSWLQQYGLQETDVKTIVRLCSRRIARDGFVENETLLYAIYHAFCQGKYDDNLITYLVHFYIGTIRQMRDIWKAAVDFEIDAYDLSERIIVQLLYSNAYMAEQVEIFKSYVSGGARAAVESAFLGRCSYDYFVHEGLVDDFIFYDVIRVYERGEKLHKVCKLALLKYYAENKPEVRKDMEAKLRKIKKLFLEEVMEENIYFPFFKEYVEELPALEQFNDKTMIEYRAQQGSRVIVHYLIESAQFPNEEYRIEEMRNMYGGIYVKTFVLFSGERLLYYISEEKNGQKELTKSATVVENNSGLSQNGGRFGIINDMITAKTMQDYKTVDALSEEYYRKDYMAEHLFKLR